MTPPRIGPALLAVLALATGPAASPARAESAGGKRVTAADFFALCQANAEQPRAACAALITGMIEVIVLLGSKEDRMRLACPPRRMAADQARFAFTAWAEPRDDLATMDIGTAVARALSERFPCADIDVSGRKRQ